jgi:molybdate transport system permease protein
MAIALLKSRNSSREAALALASREKSYRNSAINEVFFKASSTGLLVFYLLIVTLIMLVTARYAGFAGYVSAAKDPTMRSAIMLSLVTSTITTILALIVAVPGAYALSRFRIPGQKLLDTLVDLTIVLPPLIMGVCLLIFFSPRASLVGMFLDKQFGIRVPYHNYSVVIAQFMIAAGFAVRCLKATFDSMTPRYEQVARTLGCSASSAFLKVTLPLARDGIIAGGVMTWARAIGEFGPIIVFAGSMKGKTLVLPTHIFLNMQVGDLEQMAAATVVLVVIAIIALIIFRRVGGQLISISGSQQ